ncbi:hypothetical protein ACOSQ3_013603 [Xanthoceras sorbifolium]
MSKVAPTSSREAVAEDKLHQPPVASAKPIRGYQPVATSSMSIDLAVTEASCPLTHSPENSAILDPDILNSTLHGGSPNFVEIAPAITSPHIFTKGIKVVKETFRDLGYAESSKSKITWNAILSCPLEEGSHAFKGKDSADLMHGPSLSHVDILMVVDGPDCGLVTCEIPDGLGKLPKRKN